MARRTVIDCDRCGKLNCGAKTISLITGVRPCPVEGTDIVIEKIDLCSDCTAVCLESVLSLGTFENKFREQWILKNKKLNSPPQS